MNPKVYVYLNEAIEIEKDGRDYMFSKFDEQIN
jgi:hypothetical protein